MTIPTIQKIAESRARQYVAKIPPAVSGAGGHDQTFSVAVALLHGFALPEPAAWPILVEYGARCSPAWSIDELRHKLESAGKLTRHPKPRGYLLEGARGPVAIVRRRESAAARPRRILGRVALPDVAPADTPALQTREPAKEFCDHDARARAKEEVPFVEITPPPAGSPVPAGRCPECWTKWSRFLCNGSCVCTGDVYPGKRPSFVENPKHKEAA